MHEFQRFSQTMQHELGLKFSAKVYENRRCDKMECNKSQWEREGHMSLPALHDWQATKTNLHRASQILSAARAQVTPPLPNALRLSLFVTREGLTTGPLSFGGDLLLNFTDQSIVYRQPGEPSVKLPIDNHNQSSLAGAVMLMLADEGHDLALDPEKLADHTPLVIDAKIAQDYAAALYTVYTAAARFRARLFGPQSPIVVWPHGFDLSFLWFAGAGADEHHDRHLNFGFSPGSPGFERPYLYAYASPSPANLAELALPGLVHVITHPWKGIYVHYDDLLGVKDPEGMIESLYDDIYHALAPTLS